MNIAETLERMFDNETENVVKKYAKPGFCFVGSTPDLTDWVPREEVRDGALRGFGDVCRQHRDGWNSQLLILVFEVVCALRGRKRYHATWDDVGFTCRVLRRCQL